MKSTARTVDSTQTSLMMAAVTSSPPTAGTLNQTTGAVTDVEWLDHHESADQWNRDGER